MINELLIDYLDHLNIVIPNSKIEALFKMIEEENLYNEKKIDKLYKLDNVDDIINF